MSVAYDQRMREKTFPLWQGIILIVLSVAVFAAAGYLVGEKYFWNGVDNGRINQQLSYFKQLVDAQPTKPENRVNLGYTYYLKGEYSLAVKQFQVALDLDPKYAEAHTNIGMVYYDQKKFDEALESFQRAAELAPLDYKNHLYKGIIYTEQKKYNEAIKALNEANKQRPGASDVLYRIGVVAEKTGDKQGAIEMYQEALRFDPLAKEAKEALQRLK